ncbi:MAG: L7Ae/L30e/S12e/Gadd45 family ribosomal protein [Anaerovoracaceae bacterium]|jgi:ribosomal protein L7Ae-like RNA K-turn-binding protein
MREKIHSYLGFAKRSRNLISGYNSCIYGIERGKIHLLIITADLSENTKKKLLAVAESGNVQLRIYGTMEKMEEMTGEIGRGIYGITDKNLAEAIKGEIDRYGRNGKKEE